VKTEGAKGNLSSRLLILIFVILAAGILVGGYLFYSSYEKNYVAQVGLQLSAVGDLKAGELEQWRKERIGDANLLFGNPAFSGLVQRYFEHPDDVDAREQLRSWLTSLQANDQYTDVYLLDQQGAGRVFSIDTAEPVPRHIPKDAQQALQTGKVTVIDLDDDEATVQPHMVLLTPIFSEKDGNLPLGVVVMNIDPDKYLYPLIQLWPTPSTTAETLIVRRDGNDSLFLNELRFQKDTALKLRIPLDKKDIAAVKAVMGQEGIVRGRDYRGQEVIADIRHIPDSPWYMVARMDASEVYAPLAQMLWAITGLLGALLIGAGAGVGMVWRQQNLRVYAEKYEASEELRQTQEKASEETRRLNAELEQRVLERTSQLEAANKELEAFAYSVSHDLRAPLRGIDGWSLALLEDCKDKLDEKEIQYLDLVRSETQTMGRLIDDLLTFSRQSRSEMNVRQLDMTAKALAIVSRLQKQNPSLKADFIVQPGLTAFGDAGLIDIALTNLLDNAAKFSSKNADPLIEFGQVEQDRRNPFFVRDNGVGFDMVYANKLFGVFRRLHKSSDFPGTGIGLASVQRIINRHGGRIWAEARVNEGATFYFTIREAI